MLKVAIIGSSPGNGHCFSFSAIMNGLNSEFLHLCPFRTIREYLPSYETPHLRINEVFSANSIWMQDRQLAKDVSLFSSIPFIGSSYWDAASKSDVIMITIDEPDLRNEMLWDLMSLGKPIFVDKLLTRSIEELRRLEASVSFPRQIWSASAMAFLPIAKDLVRLSAATRTTISVPKSWSLYGIHAAELFLHLCDSQSLKYEFQESFTLPNGGRRMIFEIDGHADREVVLVASGKSDSPFSIEQILQSGEIIRQVMNNPFEPFCRMLMAYHDFLSEHLVAEDYWQNQHRLLSLVNA